MRNLHEKNEILWEVGFVNGFTLKSVIPKFWRIFYIEIIVFGYKMKILCCIYYTIWDEYELLDGHVSKSFKLNFDSYKLNIDIKLGNIK